jgi:hypothetical protein
LNSILIRIIEGEKMGIEILYGYEKIVKRTVDVFHLNKEKTMIVLIQQTILYLLICQYGYESLFLLKKGNKTRIYCKTLARKLSPFAFFF